jgi:flagella synthesis protein FlgN
MEEMLSKDLQAAQQLFNILESEGQAIQERDQTQLHELIARKQGLIKQLENSAQQKTVWLKLPVGSSEEEQHRRWDQLMKKANDPKLSQLWEDFQQRLQDCKAQNEVNGKVIARGQNTLKQLLSILRGRQQVEAPKLYNQAGTASSGPRSHTVVRA